MAHRLSKITTRTGDAGETGLGDGARVPKDSARVHALGDVDELNSALGLVLAEEVPAALREAFGEVQHDLFDLGGELSIPGHTLLRAEQVERLERQLRSLERRAAGAEGIHPARRLARRGRGAPRAHGLPARREERGGAGARPKPWGEHARRYLNRLSDLLFVAARVLNRHAGRGDVQWRHQRKKS